jgi:hypothetical protein
MKAAIKIIALLALVTFSGLCFAYGHSSSYISFIEKENFYGWNLAYSSQNTSIETNQTSYEVFQYVPSGESVADWSEMITIEKYNCKLGFANCISKLLAFSGLPAERIGEVDGRLNNIEIRYFATKVGKSKICNYNCSEYRSILATFGGNNLTFISRSQSGKIDQPRVARYKLSEWHQFFMDTKLCSITNGVGTCSRLGSINLR